MIFVKRLYKCSMPDLFGVIDVPNSVKPRLNAIDIITDHHCNMYQTIERPIVYCMLYVGNELLANTRTTSLNRYINRQYDKYKWWNVMIKCANTKAGRQENTINSLNSNKTYYRYPVIQEHVKTICFCLHGQFEGANVVTKCHSRVIPAFISVNREVPTTAFRIKQDFNLLSFFVYILYLLL